ncbi:amino acid adenylation domain-containing protein [Streptomyces sp. NPDC001717]|uniref:non-ribosomal peptide synthetase n=1 Tax=Streptomyces sp. NPDC001717 TaxID=3364604 RepID=UPI00368CD112
MPASSAQRRLYFLDRYQPGSPAYLVPAAFELHGALDRAVLERALSELVRRHQALRTTYEERDGELFQITGDPQPVELGYADLTSLAPAERAERLHRAAAAEHQEPMDLARGPLFRTSLLRTGPDTHRLVLVLHHIYTDGWTLSLLVRECVNLYEAFAAGYDEGSLAAPALQYPQHALRERAWLSGPDARADLDWWVRNLRDVTPLELPADRPRPPTQGWAGARIRFDVPAALATGARALADRTGTTLFPVLLAVYQIALSRWSGRLAPAVGTPVAGRVTPELETMAGLVANTLVLRTDLSDDPSFETVVERAADALLDAHDHQSTPFESLVDVLDGHRDPSRHPLVQTTFTLQNVPPFTHLQMGGTSMRFLDMEGATAKFDLSLTVLETEGALTGELEYSTDLFEAATVRRFAGHFLTLLGSAVRTPMARAAELTMTTEEETHALLAAGRGSDLVPSVSAPVHEHVARIAREAPDTPAVVAGGRSITYAELQGRAAVLAARLREHGAGPEQLVGVCLERSAEQIVACLAVLMSGAAYVPLDPQYPADRLGAIRENTGLAVVVTDRRLRPRFPMARLSVLCVDEQEPETAAPTAEEPTASAPIPHGTHPDRLAYVIHTSGSTGRPKGVAVTHRNLANLVSWHIDAYGLRRGTRTTLVASPGFDAAVWEIWPALVAGSTLHVPDDGVRADPDALARWLADESVEICFLPTPLAEALLDRAWPAGSTLRALLTGGDALAARPAPDAPFRLINHYGPTENTVVATAGAVAVGGSAAGPRPDIGRPVAGTQAYVLDGRLRPVPAGVVGELYLGGAQVARGYLGAPRQTADCFVPDPFRTDGGRLYRTGDHARLLPDGRLEFVGRSDGQVKIRGFRIELGEVEAALRSHPAVADAAVTLRDGDTRERTLTGHVVPRDEASVPSPTELRQHLRHRVPSYMVPSRFTVEQVLPLTVHGKLDRRALGNSLSVLDEAADSEPPRGPLEERIAEIWCSVLGTARVGAHENFFDLGGHSFLALQVQTRLREICGEVPVVALFQYPTVAALAAYARSVTEAGSGTGGPVAEQAGHQWQERRRAGLSRARVRTDRTVGGSA